MTTNLAAFNDTLDDFSFSESGSFLNEINETTVDFAAQVSKKEPSLKESDFTEEKLKTVSNCATPIELRNKVSVEDINLALQSISFDDSVFFNEPISLVDKNVNSEEQIVSIKNSEELFTDVAEPEQSFNKTEELIDDNSVPAVSSSITKTQNEEESSNNCDLAAWGLPDPVLQKYKNRGITHMFSWQATCLGNLELLQQNCNLVYSAPTSAGKTLVAEILAIKAVFERRKKVLFILPFISVVREKMFYFQDILGSSGVRVEGFMGSHNPPGGFQSVQVAVCTIEKANGIINRQLEDGTLSDIGAVIIDEMHLLGDPSRGYLLELMLTKLQYMTIRYENIHIQIIGMSATLPNLALLGKWLHAKLYTTNFRPIPLYEQCLVGGEIYNKNLLLERQLLNLPELETDTDNILQLCLETIQNSCSVLIFCPTKNWCENLAQQIAVAFWKLGCSKTPFGLTLRHELKSDLISELLEQLKRCPVGLDSVLQKTVSYGAAFHHAGLTMDERDIIEAAFRNGALRVLVATSTLSSGVNLPARRVIIRTPMFHGKPLDGLVYRQMIGRAGRMGKDTCGESILVCQKNDYRIAKELLSAELNPIESCLEGAGKLKRAILEVIASGVAATPADVELFTKCTLLAASEIQNEDLLMSPIDEAIAFLSKNEFIRLQKLEDGSSKYLPTSLGKACLSSSMPPEEGLALFSELEKARQCFVLETELHLIYLVTPYSVCNQWSNLDWMLFLELWEKLPSSMKRVGELVGIRESYIISGTRNKIQTNTAKLYQKLQIHRRFFTALALQDLVNEVPLNNVATKFGCARGMLQSLQQSASTFAGMLTIFSKHLGWASVEILISQFQDRLQFGISRDLLDLMRLPILNGPRARALHNAGIETLVHLASSDVYAVENVLHKVGPFESEKERDGETKFDADKRNKIRGIWVTGKEGLTEREAAVMLINDARRYLQLELGLAEAKWEETIVTDLIKTNEEIENNINKSHQNSSPVNNCNVSDHNTTQANSNSIGTDREIAREADYLLQPQVLSEALDLSSCSMKLAHSNINKPNASNIVIQSSNDESGALKKNIFLNSSDQSLFEESFDLNAQLANCAISVEKLNASQPNNDENSSSNGYSGDSGLDFDNGSFLENAFVSSFDLEPSTSENKSQISSEVRLDSTFNKFSPGSDLIASSQLLVNSVHTPKDSFALNFPKSTISRKRERRDKENFNKSLIVDDDESVLEQTPTKKRKMQTRVIKSVLSTTAHSDCSKPVDFTKLYIVDVFKDDKLYQTFCEELFEQTTISLSFACRKISENRPIIGFNIVGKDKGPNLPLQQFANKGRSVVGLAISWGDNVAYYISFENSIIPNAAIIDMLKNLLSKKTLRVRFFDCKQQIKTAKLCCGLDFCAFAEDPKVADWILQPEEKEKNLQALALKYTPEALDLSQVAGNCKGVGSLGLNLSSSIEPRLRAAVEVVVTWHLCHSVCDALVQQDVQLLQTYKTEMNSILCLAQMELNGIGVDMAQLQSLAQNLKTHTSHLEKQAYMLAGRHFSFTSSADVAKVLGLYRGRKVSTNKQALEQQDNPIARLIVQWRKLNSTLTKMVYPLNRLVEGGAIHGSCITHNSTGRISMHEPNLQNTPRDFEIEDFVTNLKTTISCRMAFIPREDCVFLSADYCQLELRLLAHLSQDALLCSIMKSGEDVFKSVAAAWKNILETQVDDVLRQWAKQLCYGIIYGMGTKTLSEQLSVSEEEATDFSRSFLGRYPNIKKYIEETVNKCNKLGYVETLNSRRRYLPNINHPNPSVKGQAERQAVNTTVQGSAADIAKSAMVIVDERFRNKFRHSKNLPKLVLQLHDEFLYEVPKKYLHKTAKILKESMEEAVKLSVPFPIKLKSGSSWGTLTELILK